MCGILGVAMFFLFFFVLSCPMKRVKPQKYGRKTHQWENAGGFITLPGLLTWNPESGEIEVVIYNNS